MKLFQCSYCGQPLFFENDHCESCGHQLGYIAETMELVPLDLDRDTWIVTGSPERRYRFCANAVHGVCNWLVKTDESDTFCLACRHNLTIPDLSYDNNIHRWQLIELAKHRLFFTLIELRLPLKTRAQDPIEGLVFDFKNDHESDAGKVLTGHDKGLITLNVAEADDAEREQRREAMGEAYRTLLGHFRHEIGHYYWDRLIRDEPDVLSSFRDLFGDESQDYQAALKAHYASGPPTDWRHRFVTAYGSSHPWEDFAETWAHYLHIIDSLETASEFGLSLTPHIMRARELSAIVHFDPQAEGSIQPIVKMWLPLTFAVNSLNRGMGLPDLYPFVLSPLVVEKLGFIHHLVHGTLTQRGRTEKFAPAMANPEPRSD